MWRLCEIELHLESQEVAVFRAYRSGLNSINPRAVWSLRVAWSRESWRRKNYELWMRIWGKELGKRLPRASLTVCSAGLAC
jgi:hypothetical protein